jgi:hypothetical protein
MKDPDVFKRDRLSMTDPALYREVHIASLHHQRWRGSELVLSFASHPSVTMDLAQPPFLFSSTWEQQFNSISELNEK